MEILNFFREAMTWDEKIHGSLQRALNHGNIAKAVDVFKQNFKNADELVKFPSILEALEKALITCFQPVEQSGGVKDFHILTIPRATQLRQGDYDSIERAVQAKSFYKDGKWDLDVLGDRDLRRALLIALMKNFTNQERLFNQNIDKIDRGFLSVHEEILRGAAASATEFFREQGNKVRAREIEQAYLATPDVVVDKSSRKNIA